MNSVNRESYDRIFTDLKNRSVPDMLQALPVLTLMLHIEMMMFAEKLRMSSAPAWKMHNAVSKVLIR